MCAILGAIHRPESGLRHEVFQAMRDHMSHRGPDGAGSFCEDSIHHRFALNPEPVEAASLRPNVWLGHRRLSILDLSEAGSQPMIHPAGNLVISYNGEVYNHEELRTELQSLGCAFRSRSDTETLLHAYAQWGEGMVERLNGMFALAIWDRALRKLFLARDRFGIKPLYYYSKPSEFIFASEIKSILASPEVPRRVHHGALNEYFTFQNTLGEQTMFSDIKMLPAGCTMTVTFDAKGDVVTTQRRYWDYSFSNSLTAISFEEAREELLRLFRQAVKRQLMSDVPVGCFLSGGMDSGAICAVASGELGRMHSFTGGFDLSSASGLELGFDERAAAELLSNYSKTEHYEMVMHAGDMEHVMPELSWHVEDLRVGQCYPNYYVARLAGKFVKVCLSGAGGDELFAGYPWRYHRGTQSQSREEYLRTYYQFWQRLVPDDDKSSLFRSSVLASVGDKDAFNAFHDVFNGFDGPVDSAEQYLNASLYFELKTFLHGLLVVEDRVSMAHSLEVRVPFLDNDLVDFAQSLPARHKLRNWGDLLQQVDEDDVNKRHKFEMQSSAGKLVLREAMSTLIPTEVVQRKKQGFSAPDASWFRGESISYINNLLHERDARLYEFIDPAYAQRVLDEHCSGKTNRRLLIWSFLSFEWWLRHYLK